jgi:formate-dependent nitrite reductase membrane component NrfD
VFARLFDIRNIVGALLLIYGVLLTIAGFFPGVLRSHNDTAAASDRVNLYIGTAANWWVGLILIGVAVTFISWALLRPHHQDEVGASSAGIADPQQRDGVRD